MADKVIKIQIEAGKANPSPPLGPILGQNKINIMNFCKAFNDFTKNMEGVLPVIIKTDLKGAFTFVVKKPTNTFLIKNLLSIKSGASKPGLENIMKIKSSQLLEIAKIKCTDMSSFSQDPLILDKAVKTLSGSARSMGLEVLES